MQAKNSISRPSKDVFPGRRLAERLPRLASADLLLFECMRGRWERSRSKNGSLNSVFVPPASFTVAACHSHGFIGFCFKKKRRTQMIFVSKIVYRFTFYQNRVSFWFSCLPPTTLGKLFHVRRIYPDRPRLPTPPLQLQGLALGRLRRGVGS